MRKVDFSFLVLSDYNIHDIDNILDSIDISCLRYKEGLVKYAMIRDVELVRAKIGKLILGLQSRY